MRRHKFSVDVLFNIEDCESPYEETFIVEGMMSDAYPGNRKGHPDYWSPPCGAEIEDVDIFHLNGKPVSNDLFSEIFSQDGFHEKVYESLSKRS